VPREAKKISKENVMNTTFDYLEQKISKISDRGFVVADELKLIPRGTFGGTIYQLGFLRDGKVINANTGDQGGGQN
jgi:hypothetical protein